MKGKKQRRRRKAAYARPTPTFLHRVLILQGQRPTVSSKEAGKPLPEADLPFSQRDEHRTFQLHEHPESLIHVLVRKAFSSICNDHAVGVGGVNLIKF